MDLNPESTMSTSCDRSHKFITGKRIDDHRGPCSSFGIVEASSSSYNSGGGQSSSDDEEEDMANCLMMLAQGVSPVKEHRLDHHKTNTTNLKIRCLKEITTTTTTRPNSIFHNYECKTCNRAFPTFQALGGHRASHKKPKLTIQDKNSFASMKLDFSEEDQLEHEENKFIATNNKFPYLPSGFIEVGYTNKKVKVHECSICGSEFFSGQALGGHMRRHRPIPPSTTTQITAKSHVLSLDLNLPPPEVVEDVHSQPRPLVFSAVALVDCHY